MVYKEYKMGSYSIHTIKTDKFKLCHMEIIFRNNIIKEDITKRNILFDILSECNSDYPTKRDLALRLEELYNASFYAVNSKVGNAVITNLCLDFINPEYSEKKILEATLKLPFEMIFNPLVNAKEFNPRILSIIKERLASDIKRIKENPRKYAFLEAVKGLPIDSPSGYDNIGCLDDLDAITPSSLYEYYETVLKHDYVDVYIIGNLNMDEVVDVISKYATFKVIKNHNVDLYVNNKIQKLKLINDSFVYVQTNIVMLLQLSKATAFEKNYVANIYNMILGGGVLENKLSRRLRTENSLCYNASSLYQKYDGLIVISTSVDINAKDKAIKLIKQSVKDMKDNITEEELANAKEMMIAALGMGMDSIGKIVDNYFYHNISDVDDYETRVNEFKKVTLDDIKNLNKKISFAVVYTLEGGEANEEA